MARTVLALLAQGAIGGMALWLQPHLFLVLSRAVATDG